MLRNLQVKNLALIEEAQVSFGEGLNILTGETGAGKSIILGSIQLALGEKIPKDFVRDETKSAIVELEFELEEDEQIRELEAFDIPMDEGRQVILSRRITNGRSVSRVNGETVSAGILKDIAAFLIDIHGQQEHQILRNRKKHLEILDTFARESLQEIKETLKAEYKVYQKVLEDLEAFQISESEKNREMDLLQYEVQEIKEAALRAGEEEELEAQYKRLNNARKILSHLNEIKELTGFEENQSAGSSISRALRSFHDITEYDDALAEQQELLATVEDLLSDFSRSVSSYIETMEFEGEAFEEIEERLNLIHKLEAKYGASIEEVLKSLKEKEERLFELADYEEQLGKKKLLVKKQEKRLAELSASLTKLRKTAAVSFEKAMKKAMLDLNFLDVAFEITFVALPKFTASGLDEVAFLISTNPGEKLKPIEQVASGGELSRMMLALKSVLAEKDATSTLIFDEIDVGISGRTAQKVSEKMAGLARRHQIIAITHLAQIAAMADTHFLIEKKVQGQETRTQIRELKEIETIEELARIQGGAEITETVRESAKEMKRLAEAYKEILPV